MRLNFNFKKSFFYKSMQLNQNFINIYFQEIQDINYDLILKILDFILLKNITNEQEFNNNNNFFSIFPNLKCQVNTINTINTDNIYNIDIYVQNYKVFDLEHSTSENLLYIIKSNQYIKTWKYNSNLNFSSISFTIKVEKTQA